MTPRDDGLLRPARDDGAKLATQSLGLNVLLTLSKYLLYLATGSAALLAETVHSLTDVVGTFLLLGGILLAEKRSTQFPWGFTRRKTWQRSCQPASSCSRPTKSA